MKKKSKFLCLPLCLALLLSISAGAAFADQSKIVHQAAVNRCVELKIINGYSDGTYRPGNNISRAEACKMICVTLNGGSEGNLSTPARPTFNDVRSDKNSAWAESYIEYCASLGIVAGTSGGRFEPSANVTATQLAKMLLTAMGYDANRYGFIGSSWAYNVNRYGEQLGLFDSLYGLNKDAALSRDDDAQILVNAMNADDSLYGGGGSGSVAPTPTPKDLYKSVLDKCYTALTGHWDRDTLESNGFSYLYAYYSGTSDIGYAFIDIDGNGVQELLIGDVYAEGNSDGMIFDLYTISNGTIVHILSSGERDRYYLCTNGMLANEWSSGATNLGINFYMFNGSKLSAATPSVSYSYRDISYTPFSQYK